jgi:glutamyl-tRNA synthetase
MAAPVVVRIAPSPTGDPHVGTAYMALFNSCIAKKAGGRFLLRVEDTDRTRYDATSEARIVETLRWLGFSWDEGPDVGGPSAPYRQSERTPLYRERAAELLGKGAAYRCFCTEERLEELRATQRARKVPPGYDGRCRALAPDEVQARLGRGEAFVVRLAVPKEGSTSFRDDLRGEVSIENRTIDDQVLLKSDGFPTYHLANVVDDHAMGVTHVVRGEEWMPSTPKHVLLYAAFGWTPPKWMHMPLLRNADKSKVSKRKNHTSLVWYRDRGFLPEALVNFLALMGYSHPEGHEVFSFDEMLRTFDASRVTTSGPVFDLAKLEWLNGEWIRRLDEGALAERIAAHFLRPKTPSSEEGAPAAPDAVTTWLARQPEGERKARLAARVLRTVPIVRERIKTLSEYAALAACFFRDDVSDFDPDDLVAKGRSPDESRDALGLARERLSAWPSPALA